LPEIAPGSEDDVVIEMAVREQRVLITEDRDFGQLVYATAKPTSGVILLRFPATARAGLPALVVDLVRQHGAQPDGRFVVVHQGGFASEGSREFEAWNTTIAARTVIAAGRAMRP
jgi:hypothetical protein